MFDSVNLGAGYAASQGSLPETQPDVTPDSVSKKRNKRSKAWTHFTLTIPISTVASGSAFSTSGRILDDFRSSLTPATLQALICTQDWLRSKPINVELDLAELTKLEEGT